MEKSEIQRISSLVLKAVAVGMSIASIVMGFIPGVDIPTATAFKTRPVILEISDLAI